MANEPLYEESVAALINRLSRHQAAFNNQSDLKIGRSTVNSDYLESIQMLTEMRKLLFPVSPVPNGER